MKLLDTATGSLRKTCMKFTQQQSKMEKDMINHRKTDDGGSDLGISSNGCYSYYIDYDEYEILKSLKMVKTFLVATAI